MIARYSTERMEKHFSLKQRFEYMKNVEIACAQIQAEMGIIPKNAAQAITKKAHFQIDRILEIEKTTKHDVIAFISNLAENVGAAGRYIHFGLTSSDVLDTALNLQVSEGFEILFEEILKLRKLIYSLAVKHKNSICAGRTHGIYAEITTFGYKLAGFLSELDRNIERLKRAQEQIKVCKLSGAVGTSSALPIEFETRVAKKLGLTVEKFATQVVPRDRHLEVIYSLASLAAGYERLAVELRHLQRSEVSEVIEGFTPGQKGSSAMPHKKNPISAENMTGLARVMRSYVSVAFENVALWHERDISHSSTERIIFPDAFQLAHYMTVRMHSLLSGLYIDTGRMYSNTQSLGGVLYSSHLLLHLVKKHGYSREEAYKLVQKAAHELKPNQHLSDKIMKDPQLKKLFSKSELDFIFSGRQHQEAVAERLKTYLRK